MKFVFCTEPVYEFYRANVYIDKQTPIDRQILSESGEDNPYSIPLDDNIIRAELTNMNYPRNLWNNLSQLISKLTYKYLIESPIFEEVFTEVLFNQSEAEFFEFYNIINHFYNGAEIFIIVGNDSYSDMVTQVVRNVISKTYGIYPQVIYDIDDIYNIRDDIDFSPEGSNVVYLQRPYYLNLLVKSQQEPLSVWYPFENMEMYINALEN